MQAGWIPARIALLAGETEGGHEDLRGCAAGRVAGDAHAQRHCAARRSGHAGRGDRRGRPSGGQSETLRRHGSRVESDPGRPDVRGPTVWLAHGQDPSAAGPGQPLPPRCVLRRRGATAAAAAGSPDAVSAQLLERARVVVEANRSWEDDYAGCFFGLHRQKNIAHTEAEATALAECAKDLARQLAGLETHRAGLEKDVLAFLQPLDTTGKFRDLGVPFAVRRPSRRMARRMNYRSGQFVRRQRLGAASTSSLP